MVVYQPGNRRRTILALIVLTAVTLITLDKTPPELAADIMEKGIVITGGGALLHGLDSRLASETGMPIRVAENPLTSVALGSGQCLEEFDALKQVLISSQGH